ncbi:hypothetical protein BDV12DRAFT_191538 [Aspergillus spectabilis]
MQLIHLLAAGLIPALVSALLRRDVDCLFATTPANGATCQSFASNWGLSVSEFQELNPGTTCPDIDTRKAYCVVGTVTEDAPGTTLTTTTSTSTTTTPKNTTTTTQPPTAANPTVPTPTMPGIVDNCDSFYKVSSGDQCETISQRHSITTAQLRSWNSEINTDCTNLWLDYYICVHVPGATTTSLTTTTTTNAIVTGPTPQQTGIISNCNKYHLVESGDGCTSIASAYGISLSNFYSWNPAVGSSCGALWLGYYVCPMPGIVSNCKRYYQVKVGDDCWSIQQRYGITAAQFNLWNPMVGSSCGSLWQGYFVCVAI